MINFDGSDDDDDDDKVSASVDDAVAHLGTAAAAAASSSLRMSDSAHDSKSSYSSSSMSSVYAADARTLDNAVRAMSASAAASSRDVHTSYAPSADTSGVSLWNDTDSDGDEDSDEDEEDMIGITRVNAHDTARPDEQKMRELIKELEQRISEITHSVSVKMMERDKRLNREMQHHSLFMEYSDREGLYRANVSLVNFAHDLMTVMSYLDTDVVARYSDSLQSIVDDILSVWESRAYHWIQDTQQYFSLIPVEHMFVPRDKIAFMEQQVADAAEVAVNNSLSTILMYAATGLSFHLRRVTGTVDVDGRPDTFDKCAEQWTMQLHRSAQQDRRQYYSELCHLAYEHLTNELWLGHDNIVDIDIHPLKGGLMLMDKVQYRLCQFSYMLTATYIMTSMTSITPSEAYAYTDDCDPDEKREIWTDASREHWVSFLGEQVQIDPSPTQTNRTESMYLLSIAPIGARGIYGILERTDEFEVEGLTCTQFIYEAKATEWIKCFGELLPVYFEPIEDLHSHAMRPWWTLSLFDRIVSSCTRSRVSFIKYHVVFEWDLPRRSHVLSRLKNYASKRRPIILYVLGAFWVQLAIEVKDEDGDARIQDTLIPCSCVDEAIWTWMYMIHTYFGDKISNSVLLKDCIPKSMYKAIQAV